MNTPEPFCSTCDATNWTNHRPDCENLLAVRRNIGVTTTLGELRIYRILAEFSDGALINHLVSEKDADDARRRLDDLIKRVLSLGSRQLVEGTDQVSLESVIFNNG